jgi:hypothetical protein
MSMDRRKMTTTITIQPMVLPIGMVRNKRKPRTEVQNMVSHIMFARIEAIGIWLQSLGITETNQDEYVIDHE